MNKILLFVLFLLPVFVFALGGRERQTAQPAPPVTVVEVTGIVRLVGNAPFYEIVISGERNWYVARDEMNKLHDLQHRIVTVEGEETITELTFASGLPAGRRRELNNIRIIEVQ